MFSSKSDLINFLYCIWKFDNVTFKVLSGLFRFMNKILVKLLQITIIIFTIFFSWASIVTNYIATSVMDFVCIIACVTCRECMRIIRVLIKVSGLQELSKVMLLIFSFYSTCFTPPYQSFSHKFLYHFVLFSVLFLFQEKSYVSIYLKNKLCLVV